MNRYSSGNTYDLDETGRQGIIMNKYGFTATSILYAWILAGLFNSIFKYLLLSLCIGAMLASVSLCPTTP